MHATRQRRLLVVTKHLYQQQKCKIIQHNYSSNNTAVHEYWEAVKAFTLSPFASNSEYTSKQVYEKFKHVMDNQQQYQLPDLITRQLQERYTKMDEQSRLKFFEWMNEDFGINWQDAHEQAKQFVQQEQQQHQKQDAAFKLRNALEPQYEKFLGNIMKQPQGMKFVIDMRSDLLQLIDKQQKESQHYALLRELDQNLSLFLTSWFSSAFLQLKKLDWSHDSAELMEKLIQYERVHPMKNFDDLKFRIGALPLPSHEERLLFAMFHPMMPKEPLAFIQVAIMNDMPSSMQQVLHPQQQQHQQTQQRTAVFYSITSAHNGLSGIDIGQHLIKKVVLYLLEKHAKHPIQVFCTLSPIPGFSNWLKTKLAMQNSKLKDAALFTESERTTIMNKFALSDENQIASCVEEQLQHLAERTDLQDFFKPILLRLCARYLLVERKRKRALDPVTNFHVRNGAQVARINYMANTTKRGMQQSYGLMVNYHYVLQDLEQNNYNYVINHSIAASPQVQSLLQ